MAVKPAAETAPTEDTTQEPLPGADAPPAKGKATPEPKTPERVKVKVGDNEIETDAASAAVINALMQNNGEMAELIRKGYKTAEPTPAKKVADDEYDFETGLFTEPKVAIAKLEARIRASVMNEVTTAYTSAETTKSFWSGFYSDHEELKDEKLIVNAVMQRDWDKLKDMKAPDAAKHLAEASKKEIMRLSGGKSPSDPNARPVEGGGEGKNPAPRSNNPADEKVLSLSDVIRRNKARHRPTFSSKE